jgi:hypothetical protein
MNYLKQADAMYIRFGEDGEAAHQFCYIYILRGEMM